MNFSIHFYKKFKKYLTIRHKLTNLYPHPPLSSNPSQSSRDAGKPLGLFFVSSKNLFGIYPARVCLSLAGLFSAAFSFRIVFPLERI